MSRMTAEEFRQVLRQELERAARREDMRRSGALRRPCGCFASVAHASACDGKPMPGWEQREDIA